MGAGNRTKFKEVFAAAAALHFSERSAFLTHACVDDKKMRDEIEKLLIADDAAGNFLESSPFNESAKNLEKNCTQDYVGRKIGAYKIGREIGTGGMGTVFLSTRDFAGFQQKVAVKIVHRGTNSSEFIRRFLIERKILAELEHSSIARLIDAGENAEGLPFLVMEYVEGVPLDDYCREQNLTIEKCLELFRKVCTAVSYAHRRLIIHRDLKPSNILVTADGEIKLLDFGIAKLLSASASDLPQTATAMNLLTPAYAAPEQIRGESVTTASDVYSSGVILYELLTGVRPFCFDSRNYQEIVRVICDIEPPKPSEAQTFHNKGARTDGQKNQLTADVLTAPSPHKSKSLRGDLDNIILKSLRKDPERRYQTIEQFSEDIERYLKGWPVSARPDTFSYRAIKFFERHRAAAISFGIILLLLVGGIVATTWQALRAARQQHIAEQRFTQVREIANNVIFKYHDGIANLQGSTEVRRMLVTDATKYLDNLSQEAEVDENLQNELALAYTKLADVQGKPYEANTGDTTGALKNYRKSVKLLESLTDSKDIASSSRAEEELITTYHNYSSLNSRTFDFDEAITTQKKALSLAQKYLAQDTQNLKRRLTAARAVLWLGDANNEAGNFIEAIELYRQFIDSAEEISKDAPINKDAETILGIAYDRVGRSFLLRGQELARTDFPPDKIADIYYKSYGHLEKALKIFEKVASENPDDQKSQRNFVVAQSNLGMVLRNVGEHHRSLELLLKTAQQREKELESDGGNHQLKADYAEDLHQLALTLNAKNESAKSVKVIKAAVQIMDKLIAEDNNNIEFRLLELEMIDDYGRFLLKNNDFNGALKLYQAASESLSPIEKASEKAFFLYSTGLIDQNIGDCYLQMANNSLISKNQRATNYKKSRIYYQNAINSWESPEVNRKFLRRTPELLANLNRKLVSVIQVKS